jgi:hypothetical protein
LLSKLSIMMSDGESCSSTILPLTLRIILYFSLY